MTEEVKTCVCARTDFFGKYMTVPPQLQGELEQFLSGITALGESSASAGEFEQKFQASGLSELFNSLVSRCTPKPYQMTAEDKAYAKQTAREIFREDRKRILKDTGKDVLESVALKAESDINSARIRQMSEEGVLDEYTRASNAAEDAGTIARFVRGLFGKRK